MRGGLPTVKWTASAIAFVVATLGTFAAVALAVEGPNGEHQVVVCKYVGTPGVDERLQTGQNPIVVDANALEGIGFTGAFPFDFSDKQGNSTAIRWAASAQDGGITECPSPPEPIKGELVVVKVVVNDDDGTKTASDFSFTVDGQPYAFESDGSNSFVKDPGSYTVAEVAAAGYTSSVDDGCVTVVAGQTVTVTITNDDVAPPPPTTGDASVICILPEGYYRVSGRIDGQAADSFAPATIPGNAKGVTQVVVTRGDTSHRTTVTTNGDCVDAPTTPTETTPTVPAPPETPPSPPETGPAPVSPPVTPPKSAKPTSKVAGATKTLPAPPSPRVQVRGAHKEAPSGLAYTP